MLGKLKTLAGEVLFRVVFAGVIFLQFVVLVLFLWGLSEIFPEDFGLFSGILITLVLLSPFAIGANSYFLFQRFTRVRYTLSESEKWLNERSRVDGHKIKIQSRIRRRVIWLPVLVVLLFCLFLDETWPPASHLFYPTAGRLIGHRVSVPLNWAIVFSDPGSGSNAYRSYVLAYRSRRLFRGSLEFFLGRKPSVSVSSIALYGSPPSEQIASPWRPDDQLPTGARSFLVGNAVLKCEEFAMKTDQLQDQLDIRCTMPRGELTCRFAGDRNDSASFYEMVQRIRKSK